MHVRACDGGCDCSDGAVVSTRTTSQKCSVAVPALQSTCETAPWHIWHHEVSCAALARECPTSVLEFYRPRMQRAYAAGEPGWMVVDELALVARRTLADARFDADMAVLRDALLKAAR